MNKTYLLIACIAISKTLSSCQKKTSADVISTTSKTFTTINGSFLDPRNTNNPYDSYGQDYMDDLNAINSTMPASLTATEKADFVKFYLISKYPTLVVQIDHIVEEALQEQSTYDKPYLNNFEETDQFFVYANQIDKVCNEAFTKNYSVFKAQFINLEDTILNDATINDVQKTQLLKLTSQIRFDVTMDLTGQSSSDPSITEMSSCRSMQHLRCSSCGGTGSTAGTFAGSILNKALQ
jgi:hypothetical protein